MIVATPRLVVDEFSPGLAPSVAQDLLAALRSLESRCAVVMTDQFVAHALQVADSVLVLRRGQVAYPGPAAEMRTEEIERMYSLSEDRKVRTLVKE